MSQSFSLKKIIPRIFKSQKGLDETNDSKKSGAGDGPFDKMSRVFIGKKIKTSKVLPYQSPSISNFTFSITDSLFFQDQPVTVQIAFSKTKPDGTEQLMSKESLTNMMRNDEEFNNFMRNDYKLNSTVVVEGVRDGSRKDSQIYVSGRIPVNVRRTIQGNKKNKEIHISGKLYKSESKRTLNLKRSQCVMDETTNLRNTTLRKVELPLRELRSSLSGFTKRITDFEVVPWLTVTYIPPKPNPSRVSSKSILPKRTLSPRKLDSPLFTASSIHDKNMIAMQTNLEYNQFPSGKKDPLILDSSVKTNNEHGNLSKEASPELRDESKISTGNNNHDLILDKSVSERKSYFENLKNDTKYAHSKTKQQTENLMQKLETEDSKKSYNNRKSYLEIQANRKPEISDQSLDNSKNTHVKDMHKKLETFSKSLNEKRLNTMNGPSSMENSKISNFVTISNLTYDQSHCGRSIEQNDSTPNQMLKPTMENNVEDLHEEIPVSSITITRSRTRIIKYDDGTGIEEKIGRQTFRVEAPNGSLYTCKTCLWPIITNKNNENNSEHHNKENNNSKIDKLVSEDEEVDKNENNNNSNNYSIYATQNIFQLNYPKEKEKNEENYDFNDLLGDKYNPLTWLYNNYAKTKNLIKQFNHD